MTAIAIIGMACRYAEARSPRQLWENVLAQRRSFRRIPRVRLNLADYAPEVQGEDQITAIMAAVLDDYEFDRSRFHISRDAFLSTDISHWLALDVAAQALDDARLLSADREQRERTGVYVGNSLTGEFSRANLLRLRWPYVRRVLAAAFQEKNRCSSSEREELIARIEELYKAPFPATNEESLAGGLSNTIAGRISNYFDFQGGGYTVDGACASSLLAVATACSALHSGDVDIAIAGGVDLSLDPFELAGFSSLGALARDQMRVFDARSSGFWPGEGCGMLVLMRQEDALAHHHTPYAVVRGWGISSDGQGGITRPEVAGQSLALRRAYTRAKYGVDSVAYFEGHGTGTSIGDATELQALSQLRRESATRTSPAAIGSIKANIGHTKAAAGVAGLIKATMAVHSGILPPTTGCERPHPELVSDAPALRVLREAEFWPSGAPARAGVSGFGFGGINVHVTLEATGALARKSFTPTESEQLSSTQDCELFLFAAPSVTEIRQQITDLLAFATEISYSELADLSILLAKRADSQKEAVAVRAACVASTPEDLNTGLQELLACCEAGVNRTDPNRGIFFSSSTAAPPRVGFLFPGQASPIYINGGIWSRRFPGLRPLYADARLPRHSSVDTQIAQPCIVTASLAGLHMLEMFGVQGSVAVGHSLGEITALHWAGACSEEELLRIVHARGRVMAEKGESSGAMASISASHSEVLERLNGDRVVIAARNAPLQTVISGEAAAVRRFTDRLRAHGLSAAMLPVSHAFHSPLVAAVATAFAEELSSHAFTALDRRVISTVTGEPLAPAADLKALLTEQITGPVQFVDAITTASAETDLFLEVGPGSVLSGIARECMEKPVIALDSGSDSLRGLLSALGATFALGASLDLSPLYQRRFGRPIDIQKRHSFLANPCETAPPSQNAQKQHVPGTPAPPPQNAQKQHVPGTPAPDSAAPAKRPVPAPTPSSTQDAASGSAQEVLLQLVAQRTQLPLNAIKPQDRFLRDLHLNSITISQIILEAAGRLSLAAPVAPAEYTNATIAEAAQVLERLRSQSPRQTVEKYPAGVDSWTRVLATELIEKPLRRASSQSAPRQAPGAWEIIATELASGLGKQLRREFRSISGNGLVIVVPAERSAETAEFLLQWAQAALKQSLQQVVFLQQGGGASALARTLHLENPQVKTAVVNVPLEHPQTARWAAAEANANRGFTEAHYDDTGVRREPRLKVLRPRRDTQSTGLSSDDLLLVTGGGKGIAAESALHLAKISGCRLALLGRSEPAVDRELENNLHRFAAAKVRFAYYASNITAHEAVARAIQQIQTESGPITAVLHGAGTNQPARLEEVTPALLQQTLDPKLTGLRHVLGQLDPEKLRLLVTFGSIIARSGLHGEAHYGLANEWLNLMVERWQQEHPHCRCMNLEWSVWGGIGMGQRLGVLDSLVRQGITPLPVDDAIDHLKTMLSWKDAPVSSIITGRFGNLPTLRFEQPELPLLRFLEHTRVHHPKIELIADAELSADTDPYVAEHALQGEQLLPAVMGMEAMAQAAMALEQSEALPALRDLRFEHPIVIPKTKSVTLRIAALRRTSGEIAVVVRCSSTGFQVDHFTGTCAFGENSLAAGESSSDNAAQTLPLDPARNLYGRILFHRGRFVRVEGYQSLHADHSIARLAPADGKPWFARQLPPAFVLGDPAARDAALHSIQACIPHKTILPLGVDRIATSAAWTHGRVRVHATERLRDGDNFVYDLYLEDTEGRTCEAWEGLHLRAVAPIETNAPWPLPLLVPYLERKLAELLPGTALKLAITSALAEPCSCQIDDVRQLFGPSAVLVHRPDGKPEITGVNGRHPYISRSHCSKLTLLISANRAAGCDLEQIVGRDAAAWERMLRGEEFALAQQLSRMANIALDCAATQIWTLKESLRKAGAALTQPVSLAATSPDGWAGFSAGQFKAATFNARVEGQEQAFSFGFVSSAS
jgi:enediyne polyketide synthase